MYRIIEIFQLKNFFFFFLLSMYYGLGTGDTTVIISGNFPPLIELLLEWWRQAINK